MSNIDATEKYKQQYAHFGRLNGILYKLPILFSTLIGGLWYFSYSALNEYIVISVIVSIFSFVLSIVFYFIMARFRLAFNGYIENLNKMDGIYKVSIQGQGKSTIRLIQYGLVVSAIGSLIITIFYAYLLFC